MALDNRQQKKEKEEDEKKKTKQQTIDMNFNINGTRTKRQWNPKKIGFFGMMNNEYERIWCECQ